MSEIRVPKNIRVILIIRVQKYSVQAPVSAKPRTRDPCAYKRQSEIRVQEIFVKLAAKIQK